MLLSESLVCTLRAAVECIAPGQSLFTGSPLIDRESVEPLEISMPESDALGRASAPSHFLAASKIDEQTVTQADSSVFEPVLFRLMHDQILDQETFVQGLTCLNRESSAVFGAEFTELTMEEREDVLTSVEWGSVVTRWTVLPGLFVRTLARHTLEGCFGPGRASDPWLDDCPFLNFEVTG